MWHKEKRGKKKRKTALFTIFGINRHCIQENKRPLINRHSSPFSAQTIIGHIHLKDLFKNWHFSTFTALMMIGRKKKKKKKRYKPLKNRHFCLISAFLYES